MGTSGSGKSTLMNILGLLDRPTGGSYELLGQNVAEQSDDQRAFTRGRLLGFIFQNFHLLPRTSALDNVALPLLYQGVGRAERQRRAQAALERVGLAHRAQHVPSALSGGQQQRVAIARALINNPRVVFADEPTGNLDSATTAEVMALFAALHDQGITVVMVTHEPEVAQHAERLLTFRDGRLVADTSAPPKAKGVGP
jgi:putative ABC transport system ATP-binding protein